MLRATQERPMKVIKKGRPQKGWSKECHCSGSGNGGGGCGAKLLIEQADLFRTHSYVHTDHDIYTTFKCVVCGVLTDLSGDQVPPSSVVSTLPDQSKWVDPNGNKAKQLRIQEAKRVLSSNGYEIRKLTEAETNQEMMGS
jgi:hypothetical protein